MKTKEVFFTSSTNSFHTFIFRTKIHQEKLFVVQIFPFLFYLFNHLSIPKVRRLIHPSGPCPKLANGILFASDRPLHSQGCEGGRFDGEIMRRFSKISI